MRVLIVDTYYPAFLAAHYAERPGLSERPYDEQYTALMDRAFGTAGSYSGAFERLGHEGLEVVSNADALQQRWAVEHGVSTGGWPAAARLPGPAGGRARRALLARVLAAQVADYRPDVVYVQDLLFFTAPQLRAIRGDARAMVGQIASVGPSERTYRQFDLLLSSFPHYVERFRAMGLNAEYMPLAFDGRLLDRLGHPTAETPRAYEIALVGGISAGTYRAATPMLDRVAREFDIDVWGYGAESLDPDSPVLQRFHGEAWGLDMYRVLADAKIVLNRHGEVAEGYANNMRLFEATGVAALLFTEDAPNLPDLFEPGAEVVAYTGEADLVEKLRHFTSDDDDRRRMAAAGQKRTLRDHTYDRRMEAVAAILSRRLGRPRTG